MTFSSNWSHKLKRRSSTIARKVESRRLSSTNLVSLLALNSWELPEGGGDEACPARVRRGVTGRGARLERLRVLAEEVDDLLDGEARNCRAEVCAHICCGSVGLYLRPKEPWGVDELLLGGRSRWVDCVGTRGGAWEGPGVEEAGLHSAPTCAPRAATDGRNVDFSKFYEFVNLSDACGA